MVGKCLGEFEMYVGYRTVRFAVTKPDGRRIAVWQERHLVSELDPTEVNKPHPWVQYHDLTYSAMPGEWKRHFAKSILDLWRGHCEASAEQAQEVVT